MPRPQQAYKTRIEALLKTIKDNPKGIKMTKLRAAFAVEHGITQLLVTKYLRLLADAGVIKEKRGKVYPTGNIERFLKLEGDA